VIIQVRIHRSRKLRSNLRRATPSKRNVVTGSGRAAPTVAPSAGGRLERQPLVVRRAEVFGADRITVGPLEELPFESSASRGSAGGAVTSLGPALVGSDLGGEAYLGRR